jgi:hypothetical protein
MGEQSEGKRAVFRLSGKIFVDSLPAGLCIGGRETAARRADRESDGVRLLVTEEGREKEDGKQEKEEGDNDDQEEGGKMVVALRRIRNGKSPITAISPRRLESYVIINCYYSVKTQPM